MEGAEAKDLVRARSAVIGWWVVDVLCGNRSFTFKNRRRRSNRLGLISHRSSDQLLSVSRWWR